MAVKIRKKEFSDVNVYDEAIKRIEYCYNSFDGVCVSFSGGKDSTAVLNLTIEVARRLGKLPVRAIFFDEEAIHPTTIEYVERMRNNPDVKLEWYCLQVKHRNACSNDEPFWYCWDDEKKDIWVRELPECGIHTHPNFTKGDSFQDFSYNLIPRNHICLQGIRTEESLRRYQVIARKKNDAFIGNTGKAMFAYPIYDWSSVDVWKLIEKAGYDYNRTYDIFNKTDLYGNLLRQRVCPPYGEEPLRGLWVYAECFPDMWHKMLNRVAGVSTAWRYANTELYSDRVKPDSMTWREYMSLIIENYSEAETKNEVKSNINIGINQHYNKTDDPIKDEEPHPLTGASWKFFCKMAIKGDFKGRNLGRMTAEAQKTQAKIGLTLEQTIQKHGKKN